MKKSIVRKVKKWKHLKVVSVCVGSFVLLVGIINLGHFFPTVIYNNANADENVVAGDTQSTVFDSAAYDLKLKELANYKITASTSTSTLRKWPAKAPYPLAGAILPFNRIVAYYGNFYSKGMGVLGEYPEAEMLRRFTIEIKKWQDADPKTPVMPAIDYIAVTAQGSAGVDGKYRLRMPASQIDIALKLADKVHGIVILEVQAGLSDLQTEIKMLEPYLKMPQVHLAIDPEFRMKNGRKPGAYIGSVDAVDVNAAAAYLAKLVKENNLPPKVLIVHRFTQPMVTHATSIKPLPEVQILMDMDGWGTPARKLDSYQAYIQKEPVQFTGFKLFYKNDVGKRGIRMMTPAELLKLQPQPSFIQFQ